MKKRNRMKSYKEIILQKCKKHGPVVTVDKVKKLVKLCGKDKKKLKSCLQNKVPFKKILA